jgi:hypothetical protein
MVRRGRREGGGGRREEGGGRREEGGGEEGYLISALWASEFRIPESIVWSFCSIFFQKIGISSEPNKKHEQKKKAIVQNYQTF